MSDHATDWMRNHLEMLKAQLGALKGHPSSPYHDYHDPLIFTPKAQSVLEEWIDELEHLLPKDD